MTKQNRYLKNAGYTEVLWDEENFLTLEEGEDTDFDFPFEGVTAEQWVDTSANNEILYVIKYEGVYYCA